MNAHWRRRITQMFFLSVVGLLAPRLAASPSSVDECDPIACAKQCGINEGLCWGQQGEITDDCTGKCDTAGNCDNELTCKFPI